MALSMASGIMVARRLGPELRGYFGLIVFAVNLLIVIGQFGVGYSVAYFTGKKEYSQPQVKTFLVLCALIQGIVLGSIFLLGYKAVPSKWADISRPIMLIGLVALPFSFLANYVVRMLLGMLKVLQSNISNLFKSIGYLVLVFIFVWVMRGSLMAATVSWSVSVIIAGLLSLFIFLRNIRMTADLPGSMISKSARYGSRIYLIYMLTFLSMRINIFFIQHYLSPSDLSFYQIAANVTERLWLLPNALSTVLYHTLLSFSDRPTLLTPKVCRNNLLITILLAVPIIVLAKWAVGFFYGEEYLPTAYALYSMMWGITIYPIFKIIQEDFAAHNRLGPGMFAAAAGILTNLAGNIYLVPRHGIIGAGISTSVSYSLMALIMILFYIRKNRIGVHEVLIIQREDLETYRQVFGEWWRDLRNRSRVRD